MASVSATSNCTAADAMSSSTWSTITAPFSAWTPAAAQRLLCAVAVNAFHFGAPVYVNDLVSFYADVIKVGHTSLTVNVEVYVERGLRSPEPGEVVKVTEAVLTYVAVDEKRQKRPVPPE